MENQQFIAVRSEQFSRAAGEERFVIIDRNTHEIVDDSTGHGYKSARAAHASFSFKQKLRSGRRSPTPGRRRK